MALNQFSPSRSAQDSPALLRQLGLVSATALVIANMVGTGIFTTTGFLAGDLGSAKIVLLIWIFGAVCALAGAFCYSELGINFPSSGGEYVYLTEAYGPTWGFITGWISFFAGFSAPVAAAALAFSDYLGYFYPSLKQSNPALVLGSGGWALKIGGAQTVACSLVAIFTILNCVGVKATSRVQNFLTATKLLVIVSFIALGFLIGTGNWHNFSIPAHRTSATPLAAQFAISLFYIYMSYSGWNAATYVAEEIRQPARTLPLALATGTGLVALLYVILNIVFIYGAPLESLKGVVAVGSLAASRLFSPAVTGIFSALMAVSLLSTVNAMVTVGPRVYYAMAKNGAFFPIAAKVHPRWHTPAIAILCQGLCTMLMTLTPFSQLLVYIGFSLNFFASMSVASLFLFRRRPGWQKLRVVSFAWPLIPSLFVLVGIWITLFGLWLKPAVSGAAILTVITGAIAYHFRLRARRSV
ncbi:MAG TPA: amino acid permease [Bryobacteraceae bacterium]|nr:amino acid permease [Bryobacteraceae bacterium]